MLVNKAEAIAQGLKRFYSGKRCKRGHMAERFLSSGGCVECSRLSYKNWNERNPGQAADLRQARYERSKEKVSAQVKQWRAENAARVAAAGIGWRKDNRVAESAIKSRRRALERGAEGKWYQSDIDRIFSSQGGLCNGCSIDLSISGISIDHKQPLSLGGTNWPENLQLLCGSCNSKKHAKPYRQWLEEIKKGSNNVN